MYFSRIPAGKNVPHDFNIIIEIPAQSEPVKYEADKESGLLFVDRFIGTGMRYPANYGFIPHTRALGLLQMNEESGVDAKLIAAPLDHICPATAYLKTIDDVPAHLKEQIQFFFTHYKALEKGKWVNVGGWQGVEAAHREILDGIENFR